MIKISGSWTLDVVNNGLTSLEEWCDELMKLSKCANLLRLQVQSDVANESSPQVWIGV
jgi:hypothetical protein